MPALPKSLSVEELLLLTEARHLAASGRARHIREAAGVSQGELGAAVGATVAGISKWENGQRRPTGACAIRYARLIRELADQLSRREEVMRNHRAGNPSVGHQPAP